MRYVSAERSIAAAGAAFACVEDESAVIVRARGGSFGSGFKKRLWRLLLVTGLVVA
jgi:hypothetical protein